MSIKEQFIPLLWLVSSSIFFLFCKRCKCYIIYCVPFSFQPPADLWPSSSACRWQQRSLTPTPGFWFSGHDGAPPPWWGGTRIFMVSNISKQPVKTTNRHETTTVYLRKKVKYNWHIKCKFTLPDRQSPWSCGDQRWGASAVPPARCVSHWKGWHTGWWSPGSGEEWWTSCGHLA